MWKRLDSCPGESSDRLPDGAEATEQDIRAISIGFQSEFAAQFAQPEDGFWRPAFHDVEDELGGYQNQSENAEHTFHCMDPQVFDIQALLLIKAVTVFDASAQAPVVVDFLSSGFIQDGHIGQESQDAALQVAFDH